MCCDVQTGAEKTPTTDSTFQFNTNVTKSFHCIARTILETSAVHDPTLIAILRGVARGHMIVQRNHGNDAAADDDDEEQEEESNQDEDE